MSTPRARNVVQQELDAARTTLANIEKAIVKFSEDTQENSFELGKAAADKKIMSDKIAELEKELKS